MYSAIKPEYIYEHSSKNSGNSDVHPGLISELQDTEKVSIYTMLYMILLISMHICVVYTLTCVCYLCVYFIYSMLYFSKYYTAHALNMLCIQFILCSLSILYSHTHTHTLHYILHHIYYATLYIVASMRSSPLPLCKLYLL